MQEPACRRLPRSSLADKLLPNTMTSTLEFLNSSDRAAFIAALGHLFEHSPWVAGETWLRRHSLRTPGEAGLFRDAAHLHAELCATMRTAPYERQLALIRAHPDLAGRLAQQRKLTAESAREQSSAGLGALSAAELAEFQQRNEAYRARFSFPFVICARLNKKEAILNGFKIRLNNSREQEIKAALEEIFKIAELRLRDLTHG